MYFFVLLNKEFPPENPESSKASPWLEYLTAEKVKDFLWIKTDMFNEDPITDKNAEMYETQIILSRIIVHT